VRGGEGERGRAMVRMGDWGRREISVVLLDLLVMVRDGGLDI
jgi:hypothetical protein